LQDDVPGKPAGGTWNNWKGPNALRWEVAVYAVKAPPPDRAGVTGTQDLPERPPTMSGPQPGRLQKQVVKGMDERNGFSPHYAWFKTSSAMHGLVKVRAKSGQAEGAQSFGVSRATKGKLIAQEQPERCRARMAGKRSEPMPS
jgi:hypothetical protein